MELKVFAAEPAWIAKEKKKPNSLHHHHPQGCTGLLITPKTTLPRVLKYYRLFLCVRTEMFKGRSAVLYMLIDSLHAL